MDLASILALGIWRDGELGIERGTGLINLQD
jgi:hypothetical protein